MPVHDWKVVRIIASIATRLWAVSSCALIACFILYYFYGGTMALCLLGIIFLCILYHAQDNLLYHPDLPPNSRMYVPIPTMHNLPYETITLRTLDNITLHAFWIRQPDDKCKLSPTIVYYHGNAGNMGHRLQNAWGIYHNLHCNIFMIEYRGYGLSKGSPSEKGICLDGRTALDYLLTRNDLDHNQIILFGRSLGGAVAIDVASDIEYMHKIMCVIVENTFTCIPDMAVELVHPIVRYLPKFLYKNQFTSIKKIEHFSAPCLFISGLADNLVPPRMMRILYTHCNSNKKHLLEFSAGSHNDTWIIDGYYQGIAAFINECQNFKRPLQRGPEKRNIWNEIQNV